MSSCVVVSCRVLSCRAIEQGGRDVAQRLLPSVTFLLGVTSFALVASFALVTSFGMSSLGMTSFGMSSFGMSPLGMSPFRPCKEHAASARAAEVVAVEEELRLLDVTSSSEGVAEDVGVTGRDGAGAKDDDKQRNEYLARGEDVGHSWT